MQYCDLSSMSSGIMQRFDDLGAVVVYFDYLTLVL
jgi:hypothetical protein